MILLEAMASRKAIITSNTSAMKEIVKDKKTGLLCDHENIIDIAEKIVNMAVSKKNILFAEKGYERLKNKFHIKRQLKETLKLINQ